jgi:tetratricopeptide (TPR) repeat protein
VIGLEKQFPGPKTGQKGSPWLLILSLICIAVVSVLGAVAARHFLTSSEQPSSTQTRWRQAHEAIAARDFPQAIAHLEQCLESWPFNAEAHFLMAQTCRRANRLGDWQQHLARAAVLHWPKDPIDLEMQLKRAQAGDIWEVEDALMNRLNTRPPEEVVILEAVVNGLMANDRLVDVNYITTLWIEEFPEDWLPLIYRGNAQLRLKWTEKVIDDFQRVLELKPGEVEAHLSLAIVLANQGDVQKALPHFEACSTQLPDDPRVLFGLGYCQYSLGRNAEARATLSQLLERHKDHAAGCFLQGKIELAEGEPEAAYRWLVRADRLAPKEGDVTTALLRVCGQLGRTQEAERYQRLLEEIQARDAELDKLASAVKEKPDDAELRFQLALTCLKLGRDEEAAHWFQGILWKNPQHLPTLTALADYYQSKGNQKMADHYRHREEKARRQNISSRSVNK